MATVAFALYCNTLDFGWGYFGFIINTPIRKILAMAPVAFALIPQYARYRLCPLLLSH